MKPLHSNQGSIEFPDLLIKYQQSLRTSTNSCTLTNKIQQLKAAAAPCVFLFREDLAKGSSVRISPLHPHYIPTRSQTEVVDARIQAAFR